MTTRDAPHIDAGMARLNREAARRKLLRGVLMLGGIAIVVVGSVAYWLNGGRYVGKFWLPDMTIEEGAAAALEPPVLRTPA